MDRRTAPGGAVVRAARVLGLALFVTIIGTACDTTSDFLTLDGAPVSLAITRAPEEGVVSSDTIELLAGESATLGVTAFDVLGGPIGSATALWASSDSAIATVTTGGVVNAIALGTADIEASLNGIEATLTVVVTEES